MSLGSIAQYAKEIAEPIKGFAQTVADPSKYLDKIKAYGDISGKDGEYFCNTENVGVEKRMYTDEVENFNKLVEVDLNLGESVAELNGYVNERNFGYVNEIVKCLSEKHGVDPDTVAQFSEPAKEVLMHDVEKLYTVAPDLVDHADVPFTGEPILDLMIVASIPAGIGAYAKMKGKFGNLFHNYNL